MLIPSAAAHRGTSTAFAWEVQAWFLDWLAPQYLLSNYPRVDDSEVVPMVHTMVASHKIILAQCGSQQHLVHFYYAATFHS